MRALGYYKTYFSSVYERAVYSVSHRICKVLASVYYNLSTTTLEFFKICKNQLMLRELPSNFLQHEQ